MKIVKNTKESNYKLIDFEEGFKYESINDILIKGQTVMLLEN